MVPQEQDLGSAPAGGGDRKVFGRVGRRARGRLLTQLAEVRRYFGRRLIHGRLPVVARVVLKTDALAKSHRPDHLFSRGQCPIIGGQALGTLLVGVRPDGMEQLERLIGSGNTAHLRADISTVKEIEPFTAEDAAAPLGVDGLVDLCKREKLGRVKVRLFLHHDDEADAQIAREFRTLLSALKLRLPGRGVYATRMRMLVLDEVRPDSLLRLAQFVGTQSLSPVPSFDLLAQYIPQGTVTEAELPAPDPNRKHPLVGLIDSGTDLSNPHLQAWVAERDEADVPRADQDNNHGSFVAGLAVNAQGLNHSDPRFPQVQAKLVDVVAIPKPGTCVYEDELLRTIRRAVDEHPEVRVWNLSISRTSTVCRNDAFSDFAQTLDELQDAHGVTFVICAGNYQEPPFRGWPPEDLGEDDRVYPPADSILGVTVGSLAHRDHRQARVKQGEPSPFSRRGPGAAYIPKPDVCHYGGNCAADGDYRQVGVLSVDGKGNVSEGVGTSFATPIVSSLLANIQAGVAGPISRNLGKALLIHSAALASAPVQANELRYKGFGTPSEVADILTCAPWQATLIFEPELPPHRRIFAKPDFPIPACFRKADGRVEGEFVMTLVYDPLRDPAAGAEYCRTNIDVSLGTYDVGKDGRPVHAGKIPLMPEDYKELYEKHLVQHGFKWSPVKVYRHRLRATGGRRWRLWLRLLYRGARDVARPQKLALVITMFDPKRRKPVYDDVIRAIASSNWVTADLRVDERIRLRM